MNNGYRKILEILEKSSVTIFKEDNQLFKEKAAFTALLLQGLVHSPNKQNFIKIIKNLVSNLLNLQDPIYGFFIEKHSNYSEPSALVSALTGIALIDSMNFVDESTKKKVLSSLNRIKKFLIKQEINKGSYRKSLGFNYSIVNSNASITLFMILYYKITKKEAILTKVNDFINTLRNFTLNDGAITYGIYGQKYFIPSIYYHALTLNHLIRINLLIDSKKLNTYVHIYLKWIKLGYNSKGIKWEKSGFLFSTYLNQAYAFILAIKHIFRLDEKDNLSKIFRKNIFNGCLFRCDTVPGIIKRIKIGIHVGIKSSLSIKFKFINLLLFISYSLSLRFNIRTKPRVYKKNPIFKYFGIHSGVSPPINNRLDYMTTIESFCYLAIAFDLSTENALKL
ncbi:hypothetical protein LCGC14_1230280 [marine sediment metagenome]|uniref:Squalene cyclase C-terminal domain-containing protein n=1 Tax=marine sediment metagenome TaxID=412755 RepID=A0A0F9L8S2_9ZZZZ